MQTRAAAETVEYLTDLIGRAQPESVSVAWKRMHPAVISIRNLRLTPQWILKALEEKREGGE